jgi:hypothetical protein
LQRRVPTEDPPKIFGNALCKRGCTQKIHTKDPHDNNKCKKIKRRSNNSTMDGTEFRVGDPDLEVDVLVDPDGRVVMVASRNGFILWRNPLVKFFADRTWEVDRTPLVAWGVEGSDTNGEGESEVLAEVVEDTEATDTELDD